jgi:hypothetical protein
MKLTIVFVVVVLLLVLGGCQTGPKLAQCSGSALALNPGHWQASPADLKACSSPARGQQQ